MKRKIISAIVSDACELSVSLFTDQNCTTLAEGTTLKYNATGSCEPWNSERDLWFAKPDKKG